MLYYERTPYIIDDSVTIFQSFLYSHTRVHAILFGYTPCCAHVAQFKTHNVSRFFLIIKKKHT